MKWIKIDKQHTKQPTRGSYKDWKTILAEEGGHQCVYCTISENSFGGIRNFHVEHYRPKSITVFKSLENKIENLFFACSICNSFKGDDWPSEPDNEFETAHYPDPSKVNYNNLFFNSNNGTIDAHNKAGRYMLCKLYLNRPQLIMERREYECGNRLTNARLVSKDIADRLINASDTQGRALLRELLVIIDKVTELHERRKQIAPYTVQDVSRIPNHDT